MPSCGMFQALFVDSATGEITTTQTLASLRKMLPELTPGCGFWPNCSNTHALRPKLCWADIPKRLDACGVTEPQMANLMERSGRVRATIGAGGPVTLSWLDRVSSWQ